MDWIAFKGTAGVGSAFWLRDGGVFTWLAVLRAIDDKVSGLKLSVVDRSEGGGEAAEPRLAAEFDVSG